MNYKNFFQYQFALLFCSLALFILFQSCSITDTDDNNLDNQIKLKGKLAIVAENNVLIKDLEGKTIKSININPEYKLGFVFWSKDGNNLVANFSKNNKPWYNIAIIDINNSTFTELVDNRNSLLRGYAQDFHPKENKILYLVDSVYSLGEFIEYDINSKMQKRIINLGETFNIFSIRYSPNSDKIVFSSRLSNQQLPFQLYLINPDGSEIREIFYSNYHTFYKPYWSPNGQFIALHLEWVDPPKYKELVYYDFDKKEWRTLFSNIDNSELQPLEILRWDTRSKLILFTAKDFNKSPTQLNLYTISIETKEIKLVVNDFVKLQDYYIALYLEE